jgi:hypothetical protein
MASKIENTERKSGRAVFDEHGNTSWEWQTATGVFERNISDAQLRDLTPPSLELVEIPQARKYEGLWVHDEHRAVKQERRSHQRSYQTEIENSGAFRTFWRKLAGA